MSAKDDDSPVTLDTQFLFQNSVTGEASKNHLSTLQICRILNKTTTSTITADTHVLQQLPNGTYVSTWKPARAVPVLREVCTTWYASTGPGKVGPAQSCDELDRGSRGLLYASALTNSQWKTLAELPYLQLAFTALEVSGGVKNEVSSESRSEVVQEELKAFLASTTSNQESENDEEDSYASDGGTNYVEDPLTDRWIQPSLAPPLNKEEQPNETSTKRKRKKPKFSAKNGRCWVYITGIPCDATEAEIAERFSKAGLLDLHPETQQPKVKLYRDKSTHELKGDASLCYARPESVPLAITLLDGAPLRLGDTITTMSVQAAKFEQHGDQFEERRRVNNAKRKVAKLATQQAMDWDEGAFNGRLTGGRKGLRIIVLKQMFTPTKEQEAEMLQRLESKLRSKCETFGPVEKMTVFSSNPEGVVVVKFTQPGAASDAVKHFDGLDWDGKHSKASFWDGVTDYTIRNEEKERAEEETRHEEFGTWLDNQDLPPELRLQTE